MVAKKKTASKKVASSSKKKTSVKATAKKTAAKAPAKKGSAKASAKATEKKVSSKTTVKKKTAKKAPAKTQGKKALVKATVKKASSKTTVKKKTAKKAPAKTKGKKVPVKATVKKASSKTTVKKTALKKTPAKVRATKTEKQIDKKKIKNPNVKYSNEDLAEFKERIIDVRNDAMEELRMLKERLDDLTSYNFAEESMIYSMHMAEQGSEAMEKEKTYAQIQRINEYIKKLDEALNRIKEKTYGVCRMCGCLIAKERLLAVPITTLSASYKIQKRCPDDGIDRIAPLKKK